MIDAPLRNMTDEVVNRLHWQVVVSIICILFNHL